MNPVFKKLIANGMKVGKDVYLDWNCIIDQSHCWLIEIGDRVTVAPQAIILAHDASMNRALGATKIGLTVIEDEVFIGAGAIILPGVRVGTNSVVGAGSVVTKDVEPNSVVAGNPAKKICGIEQYLEQQDRLITNSPTFHKDKAVIGKITKLGKINMRKKLKKGPGYLIK